MSVEQDARGQEKQALLIIQHVMILNGKLITTLVLLPFFILGCSPGKIDVEEYGYERFSRQVLSFRETRRLDPDIISKFHPKEARLYLRGVLLVYSESNRYIEGIYVDQRSLQCICCSQTIPPGSVVGLF